MNDFNKDRILSPLTFSSNTKLLKTFDTSHIIRSWKEQLDIDISDESNGVKEIHLYRCLDSQLDFFVPVCLAGSEILYRQLQRYLWYHMMDKWEFDQAMKDLKGCTRILEIGCGPGHFLEKVLKNTKGISVKGIELNTSFRKRARELQLPIEFVRMKDLLQRKQQYDMICSFQVLEHLTQPFDFLNDLTRLLMPGGTLILSVPNRNNFYKYQFNLLDMPPHHMTRWNEHVFTFLGTLFPLKLTKIEHEPLAPYHVSQFVETYALYLSNIVGFLRRQALLKMSKIVAQFLERSRCHRFFKGHSIYAVYEKT
jgi:2-polyprenyl-3-methyl-5-hydroxy-6-metoxy-1,4-benzoquinol methylase